jgi:hypothetical protein
MKSLGINTFHALDVTDYEGADIVLDLGEPIPEKYCGNYDFIYNGSCLDNMFNPGVALMNLSKPQGRIINIEAASSWCSTRLWQTEFSWGRTLDGKNQTCVENAISDGRPGPTIELSISASYSLRSRGTAWPSRYN